MPRTSASRNIQIPRRPGPAASFLSRALVVTRGAALARVMVEISRSASQTAITIRLQFCNAPRLRLPPLRALARDELVGHRGSPRAGRVVGEMVGPLVCPEVDDGIDHCPR